MNINKTFVSLIAAWMVLLASVAAHAHAPRENYVWINVETTHISGRFEVNVNDISQKLGVEIDDGVDSRLQGAEKAAPRIEKYLAENFSIADPDGEIPLSFTGVGVSAEADDFVQYFFKSDRLPVSDTITVNNSIFLTPDLARLDSLHRSLIVLEYNKAANKDFGLDTPFLVFTPKRTSATLDTVNPANILQWRDFLWQGVLHILKGLDHVLFVLVLLLSTVLVTSGREWRPIDSFGGALLKTAKIVTLFTIAHSITLTLAAFDLVSLNTAFIETVIALSIIAVALNNLYPLFNSHAWVLVFVFGLFHGLGFASVMSDLQFRTAMLGRILVMFNIGVELGQLLIVFLCFPLFYFLRKKRFYRSGVVVPLSFLAILVSLYWVVERTGLINYVA